MNCEECKARRAAELAAKPPENVPYLVHESDMARMERTVKKLWIVIMLLIVTVVGLFIYEAQYEDVTTTEIEATQDGGGTNIVSGGDLTYGAEGTD